jgi:hypothetical protein
MGAMQNMQEVSRSFERTIPNLEKQEIVSRLCHTSEA